MISTLQTSISESAQLEDTITPWQGPLAPWLDDVVLDYDERARRWIAICVALSLLLHLSLLLIPMTKHMLQPAAAGQTQGPLTVHLANPAPRAPAAPHEPKPPPAPHRRQIMAVHKPVTSTPTFTVPVAPETPTPPTPVQPETPPVDDFNARLEARRAARAAAEQQAAQENAAAAAASGEPSVDQRIMANINRAKNGAARGEGTGGVFEITSRGVRTGSFRFNGWHPGDGNSWHESYTVDAGEGGDVKLAIVKKVIEVIRKYKTGDFDFESHRLGRAVTMSARPADNAALEAFLMKELFDDEDAIHARYAH